MKKSLIIILVLALAVTTASAAVKKKEIKPVSKVKPVVKMVVPQTTKTATGGAFFSDVPDDHWAASAVYDLVKMGVTKGYPDGTFRGNKTISRFEIAIFLSKLAKAIGGDDLKAEINSLRNEILAIKNNPPGPELIGSYQADWRYTSLLADSGGVRNGISSYRLNLATNQKINENADLKINLDTMDYGYLVDRPVSGEVFATKLIDVTSNLKLDLSNLGMSDPVNLKMVYGPGPKQHVADPTGSLPSEVGVTYIRPRSSVTTSTKFLGFDVSGGYVSMSNEDTGKIDVNQITGTLGMSLQKVPVINALKLEATGDYVSNGAFSSDNRDLRAKLSLAVPFNEKIEASGTVGFGGKETKNMMASGALAFKDPLDTGTVATIRFAKVGSAYLSTADQFAEAEFDFAGYDLFNRPLENATVNLGGELTQSVTDNFKLIGRGVVRLNSDYKYDAPKGRLTAEGGVAYNINPSTSLGAIYRIHKDKATNDTSDLATLGMLYKF